MDRVSKSQFILNISGYFQEIQETGKEIIITENDKPILKIAPYSVHPKIVNHEEILEELRGSVLEYQDPFEPVDLET